MGREERHVWQFGGCRGLSPFLPFPLLCPTEHTNFLRVNFSHCCCQQRGGREGGRGSDRWNLSCKLMSNLLFRSARAVLNNRRRGPCHHESVPGEFYVRSLLKPIFTVVTAFLGFLGVVEKCYCRASERGMRKKKRRTWKKSENDDRALFLPFFRSPTADFDAFLGSLSPSLSLSRRINREVQKGETARALARSLSCRCLLIEFGSRGPTSPPTADKSSPVFLG